LVPFFIEAMTGEASIVHGDWRADNLMVDENGNLVVIDFQLTGTGQISYDLGYFMSQSIEPEVRRTANDAIIERYYATLDTTQVRYDRAELERSFKLATAWCLIYPVANFPTFLDLPANMQKMARAMLRRSVASILDQGSLALLPE
jgi:thiamine kinase-like enzyme